VSSGLTIRALAEAYWAAEERRDVDAVMALYEPDATYQDDDGRRQGTVQLRAFYEASARSFPWLRVNVLREFPSPGGDATAIEFDALLQDHEGQAWRILGVNVFERRGEHLAAVRSFEDRPVRVDADATSGAAAGDGT
jgi:hypothetical protein